MQHLLRARVDDQRILDTAAGWTAGHLCTGQDSGDAVLLVDETGDAEAPADYVGAARHYRDTLDGIVMCQVEVTHLRGPPDTLPIGRPCTYPLSLPRFDGHPDYPPVFRNSLLRV
jgi:hypothetical protein